MQLKRGRGQTWSLDLILAAGIFVLVLVSFYAIMSSQDKTNPQQKLKDSAAEISIKLDYSSGLEKAALIYNGKINETKLIELSQKDYEELKRIFGTDSDFCIFIEDENGKLILINGSKAGIGGDSITLNGLNCNETLV